MLIPYQMLETETLQRLLEDFVTRDGTDNGFEDSLEQRVAPLRDQLERKEMLLVFHPATGDAIRRQKPDVLPALQGAFLAAHG